MSSTKPRSEPEDPVSLDENEMLSPPTSVTSKEVSQINPDQETTLSEKRAKLKEKRRTAAWLESQGIKSKVGAQADEGTKVKAMKPMLVANLYAAADIYVTWAVNTE